jgi:hypothetical protein
MLYKNEIEYQYPIWLYLHQKSNFLNTNNKHIQIINSGKLNPFEGPDIRNLCLIFNDSLLIGDAEIDIRSSNWFSHRHYKNPNFSNVILHIVFKNNKSTDLNTIVIEPQELPDISHKCLLINQIELETYALKRLKRKSFELQIAKRSGLRYLWTYSLQAFLSSINKKRKRPRTMDHLNNFFKNRYIGDFYSFLSEVLYSKFIRLEKLIELYYQKTPFSSEIVINCIIPIVYSFDIQNSSSLLSAWWSLESKNIYSKLKLRFPQFSQKYIWQQQGMLEFLYENNENKHLIK